MALAAGVFGCVGVESGHAGQCRPLADCESTGNDTPKGRLCSRRYDRERGRASKRGYGRKWLKLRKIILTRDPYCKAGGCHEWSTEVDHIKSKRSVGTDNPRNLQGMCHDCHSRKTAIEDGRWG